MDLLRSSYDSYMSSLPSVEQKYPHHIIGMAKFPQTLLMLAVTHAAFGLSIRFVMVIPLLPVEATYQTESVAVVETQ